MEYKTFISQDEVLEEDTKFFAGMVSYQNSVSGQVQGAEDIFSIGQPIYDEDDNLMGYLGLRLFNNLNYSSQKYNIDIPVEHWVIEKPTEFCKSGKKIVTYWEHKYKNE